MHVRLLRKAASSMKLASKRKNALAAYTPAHAYLNACVRRNIRPESRAHAGEQQELPLRDTQFTSLENPRGVRAVALLGILIGWRTSCLCHCG